MEPIQTIGTILDDNAERDAIHIAILPVIVDKDLWQSAPVRLTYGTSNHVLPAHDMDDENCIGIIDPFLRNGVKKGQRSWCFLKPNSITGIRHHWKHALIDNMLRPSSSAEAWLRFFANKWNFDYQEMISEATRGDGYAVARGIDVHGSSDLDAGEEDDFWKHLEELTGKKFSQAHREGFGWSCSC